MQWSRFEMFTLIAGADRMSLLCHKCHIRKCVFLHAELPLCEYVARFNLTLQLIEYVCFLLSNACCYHGCHCRHRPHELSVDLDDEALLTPRRTCMDYPIIPRWLAVIMALVLAVSLVVRANNILNLFL